MMHITYLRFWARNWNALVGVALRHWESQRKRMVRRWLKRKHRLEELLSVYDWCELCTEPHSERPEAEHTCESCERRMCAEHTSFLYDDVHVCIDCVDDDSDPDTDPGEPIPVLEAA